jgi:hypothetical protein
LLSPAIGGADVAAVTTTPTDYPNVNLATQHADEPSADSHSVTTRAS